MVEVYKYTPKGSTQDFLLNKSTQVALNAYLMVCGDTVSHRSEYTPHIL